MKIRSIPVILAVLFLFSCGPKLIIDEDLNSLSKSLQNDPNSAVAHFNVGVKHYSMEEFDKAIKYFNSSIERDPHFALAYFGLYCAGVVRDKQIHIEILKEEPDPAFKSTIDSLNYYFNSALTYDPFLDWKLFTLLLPKKETAANMYTQEVLDELYKILHDGFREFLLGNYKNAVTELDYSLAKLPDFDQAKYVRGLAKAHLADYNGAITDFKSLTDEKEKNNKEKILPIYQKSSELYFLIGSAYLKLNDLENAKNSFEKVLEEDLSFFMAHVQLSNIYQQLGNYKEALNEIDAALFLEPDDPVLLYNKGVFWAKLGKTDNAIQAYKGSIEKNEFSYKAFYNLGYVYEKMNNKSEAKKYYSNFIKKAPLSSQKLIEQTKSKIMNWE